MILEHYSDGPLLWPPYHFAQRETGTDGNFKPVGLWVSVKGDDDWPSWCEGERYCTHRLTTCTRVLLKPDANILHIVNEIGILAFDQKYGVEVALSPTFTFHQIDWERVAKDYAGIIIAPYIWSCRLPRDGMDTPRGKVSAWYYPWDCASGCIWDGEAIAAFEVAEEDA